MLASDPGFTQEQLEFLSVFDALNEPISLDMVAEISPLRPTVLLDTLGKAEHAKLLIKTDNNQYHLSSDLPESIRACFDRINCQKRYETIFDRLKSLNLIDQLSHGAHINLIKRSGKGETGQFDVDLARQALDDVQYDKALVYYEKALNGLTSRLEQPNSARLFIQAALDYANLCFCLGRNFQSGFPFLEKAGTASVQIGDKRSKVMIDLHLGRLMYISNRRHEAVALMRQAEIDVKELGDEDIKIRTAEFIALYYYMQGLFKEAMTYFEISLQAAEAHEIPAFSNPLAPSFYGFCATYLGQFHQAVGCLDNTWRKARDDAMPSLAITVRAALGTILLIINKPAEALVHLQEALQEAIDTQNELGKYFAQGGLILYHFKQGNLKAASELYRFNYEEALRTGLSYQFSSPWYLEIAFEFSRAGCLPVPFEEIMKRNRLTLNDPSCHLRGTMLRLIAEFSMHNDIKAPFILNTEKLALSSLPKQKERSSIAFELRLLKESERNLELSGDPVQLAKTRIQMARFELGRGNRAKAREFAQKARKGLSGLYEDYFPDAMRSLLDESPGYHSPYSKLEVIDKDWIDLLGDLVPSLDMEEFFSRMVRTMNRYFSAERGGIFWTDDQKAQSLVLRAACNLRPTETASPGFRARLKIIQQCFKDNTPRVIRSDETAGKQKRYGVLAMLCIPLKSHGSTCGVLYHDNSYLGDCFDFLENALLEKLADILNIHIDRMNMIEKIVQNVKKSAREEIIVPQREGRQQILAQSDAMKNILAQIDRVAQSDSTILIQGETGVGKDLLAQRVHQMSHRRNQPFVIIDPTIIPENLVESELFGHEKGAFTGADKQKKGRVELAHKGTLFIDEIGEIPKTSQAKLLRVLQEKTFSKIGGTQTLVSDFRLIAATNRNLVEEVARGNFREDLFYRINIVPISPPPLRDRSEDILLIARHFLNYFVKKYHRPGLDLTPELEAQLTAYHWPGNVRELINVIERSVILAKGDQLEINLKPLISTTQVDRFADTPTMDELQRRYIQYLLKKTSGRIAGPGGTADLLDMNPSTLYARMAKLGIHRS